MVISCIRYDKIRYDKIRYDKIRYDKSAQTAFRFSFVDHFSELISWN